MLLCLCLVCCQIEINNIRHTHTHTHTHTQTHTNTQKKPHTHTDTDKSDDTDLDDTTTDCICTFCVIESNHTMQVCCYESTCVTISQIFNDLLLLTADDLAVNPDIFSRTGVPASIAVMTNKQKRLLAYRKAFRLLIGIGRTGEHVILPSCVRNLVKSIFPDPD